MRISFSEAVQSLLAGKPLRWNKFEGHKAGEVFLQTAGARRLFHFLLSADANKIAAANEDLFDGILSAWGNSTFDPADSQKTSFDISLSGPWRLIRLETSSFGGLNTFGGPVFHLSIDGENWCLEGQNGSGKTSIVSAIIWAMTGYRVRDQDGVVYDDGMRMPVLNESGKAVGDWPALSSYPSTAIDMGKTAEAWVQLTFQNELGDTALARRTLISPRGGQPSIKAEIDPRLQAAPQLIETGLLMPARLARIGFGEKSQSLYTAVKLLTGLDQLADIGEGAANFAHGAKRFKKYAQDNGIKVLETKIESNLRQVEEKSIIAGFKFGPKTKLCDDSYADELRSIATGASDQAGQYLSLLQSDIADGLDMGKGDDRAQVMRAVLSARGTLQQGGKGIAIFDAWAALADASVGNKFDKLFDAVENAKAQLAEAEAWDERQRLDHKLRLKALASQYYVASTPEHEHIAADCPLCESKLTGGKREALAIELSELQTFADAAQQKLSHACVLLEKTIRDVLPADLAKHFGAIVTMQPNEAFATACLDNFANVPPFSDVLTGIAGFAKSFVSKKKTSLPVFEYEVAVVENADSPESAQAFRGYLQSMERVLALVSWWADNRTAFREAWSALKGTVDQDGKNSTESLEEKLFSLEAALEKSAPLDGIAKALNDTASVAEKYAEIQTHQKIREDIAEALGPLKDLRTLVAAETAASIAALAGRTGTILERIHFQESLSFEGANLQKKSVQISGSFNKGLRIDASIVANTSWLRAVLWAFILAFREQAIEALGSNPFPLTVLDDPQVSFDPRNKRKWAEEIATLANLDVTDSHGMQLFVTTHERQFFQMLVNIEKLSGEQGLVMRRDSISQVATVVNGASLARTFKKAIDGNNDQLAQGYVSEVRIYCEDLLKVMLRSEGPDVADMNLDTLRMKLRTLREASISPFNRQPFEKLLNLIAGSNKAIQILNEPHHKLDGTIGVAQATEVKDFWEKKLQSKIHTCFKVFAEFEAYSGEPRIFPWMENVVELPWGAQDKISKISLLHTGFAAAAKTDGCAGDGMITIEEIDTAAPIKLPNHEIYQLAASTIDPVAGVGDLIIVSNYAKVHERNLIVTAFGQQLLARRYNETELHPHVSILTAAGIGPHSLPQPIIAPTDRIEPRKIVGTLFASHRMPTPSFNKDAEICALTDFSVAENMLDNARLFQVSGRSAEPIALDGQFIITQQAVFEKEALANMDGRLVIAFDENGTRYFKRFRLHESVVILESLNPDGTTAAEMLSLNGAMGLPKLGGLLEVVGVLFELP